MLYLTKRGDTMERAIVILVIVVVLTFFCVWVHSHRMNRYFKSQNFSELKSKLIEVVYDFNELLAYNEEEKKFFFHNG